jgi:hypothetical protein
VVIVGTHLNLTPAFKITVSSVSPEPWRRVTGSIQSGQDWLFPAYYPFGLSAFKDLRTLAPDAKWDPSTQPLLASLKQAHVLWTQAKTAFESGATMPDVGLEFPKGFAPYRHQMMGIVRAHTWWRTFFLWEMGTGKTRTLIDAYRLSRREDPSLKRMLVLAPPVVLPTWRNEVARCSQGELRAIIWDGTDETFQDARTADVVIISYARARMEFDPRYIAANRLLQLDYQTIVADESHAIGNYEADQAAAALALSAKASRRYLASGTAGDHPGKLYPQFRFLAPALLPLSWTQFQDRYFVFSRFKKHQVFGYKNLDDLNSRVEQVATRMKKKDCLDLPPVSFVDVPFELTSAQVDEYDACIARLRDRDLYQKVLAGKGVSVAHGGALVNKLLQIVSGFILEGADPLICDGCTHMPNCVAQRIQPYTRNCQLVQIRPKTEVRRLPGAKKGTLSDLLANILNDDETNKVIVWGSYLEELNDIEDVVKALGVGYVRVDGSTTSKIGEISAKFQSDPDCRVYIGQVTSGVGVTLTAANYMVYYALTWNLTSYKQSLERNNRPGQTRKMVVYRLLSSKPGALDQFLARVLEFKDQVAYTMLERVACSSCDRMASCAKAEIRPFQSGCKYLAQIDKPTATTDYLNERIPNEGNAEER